MDFKSMFDNFANKASAAAKTAAKKTGEVAETAKLNISLKTEQSKLASLFTVLGQMAYEQANGGDVADKMAAQIMEIDEQKKVIEDLKAVIAENSGKMFCSECGKEIAIDSAFCPLCGAKQEPKVKAEEPCECECECSCEAEAAPAEEEAPAEEAPAAEESKTEE